MASFKHITRIEPETEWRQDNLGLLTRLRSIVGGISLDALLAWNAYVYAHWVYAVLIAGAGIVMVPIVYIFRYYRLQRMRTDIRLHEFCHFTRDELAEIMPLRKPEVAKAMEKFEQFHQKTAQRVAVFFRELTGDPTINCCIRIAEQVDGKRAYVTRARSDGLDQISRSRNSLPIPYDKGLAHALSLEEYQGVFLIPDIAEAIKEKIWHESGNDSLPDAKTLMVGPINGYEGNTKAMLGIISVTSKRHAFKPAHTVPLKAIVDVLGLVYPILISKMDDLNKKRPPRPPRRAMSKFAAQTTEIPDKAVETEQ